MESVASKKISKPMRKTEKHIAPPATADEIRKGLGITRKDRAVVRKVLTELGYIGKKSAKPRTTRGATTKLRKN